MIYDYIRWYEWLFYHVRLNCSVQSLSRVWLFASPWTAAHQASLSITNSRSPLKPMSIESVMPSNHLILCCPLLLLHSIFPNIRVFSNESVLHIRWPKYRSFFILIKLINMKHKEQILKATNNTQGDSHKDNSLSFNRNSSGQKGMAGHT